MCGIIIVKGWNMEDSRKSYMEAILANKKLLDKQQSIDTSFYKDWDDGARSTKSIGPDYDYGLAAAIGLKPDSRGHLGDIGKLPNHPTYSDESVYGKEGIGFPGRWIDNTYHVSEKLEGQGLANKIAKLKWLQDNGYSDGDMYKTRKGLIL